MEPQQPCQGHCSPGSTGASAKGPISGHLPGFSSHLCTFPAAHPCLLQLLGPCCANRAGGHRSGPCRFLVLSSLPAPSPTALWGAAGTGIPCCWAVSRGAAALSAPGYFKPAAVAENIGRCWMCHDPKEGKVGKVGCSDRAGFMSLKTAI